MAIEVRYVGGSNDGKVRRTRSLCDIDRVERFIWRETDSLTGNPTGRVRRENYLLDFSRREYVLQGDIESGSVN